MAERDPHRLSEALDRGADELERQSEKLERQVEEARQDWQRKRADESVPGAPPPEAEDDPPGEAA